MADTPQNHHIDKRAADVAASLMATLMSPAELEIEPLYSTPELAERLGVSTEFLEIGRHRGYGPRYVKLSPRRIRYRRSDVVAWLEERAYRSTAEYETSGGRPRKEAGDATA